MVVLHYLNEYLQEEVSQILQIPLGTVPQKFDNVTEYLLKGYFAKYGEGKNENGLIIWLPNNDEHSAYHIYVAGKLKKQDLEKIALSMTK